MIRECFSTSILLGSLDDPVTPSGQCSPEPVESEAISACLCTSDLCNDLDQGESGGGRNRAVVTTTSAVTQQPRHERTFSPLRDNSFNQITTASTASSVFPAPSRSSRGIRCFTCGTLFSRDGNSQCQARRIRRRNKPLLALKGWDAKPSKQRQRHDGPYSSAGNQCRLQLFLNGR